MKKQKSLGLIEVLLIIGVLILTAGGVVVWERKISPTPTPILTPTPMSSLATPSPISKPASTASDEKYYCQSDADCDFNHCQHCDVQNRNFISDKDRMCKNYCGGVPKCVDNQCRWGFIDSTPQIVCEKEGGTWKYFTNSCANNCLRFKTPVYPHLFSRIICLDMPTFGCQCGENQCWNGAQCISLDQITW